MDLPEDELQVIDAFDHLVGDMDDLSDLVLVVHQDETRTIHPDKRGPPAKVLRLAAASSGWTVRYSEKERGPTRGADAMKVDSVLKGKGRNVETIRPDQGMAMVLHKLTSMGFGALVVSTDGQRVDGLIAERDITRALHKHGARVMDMHVSDVMSKAVPVCSAEDTLKHVMEQMTRTRNRHVPVLDDGKLCGLVSIGDVVKHLVEEVELESRVLRDYVGGRRAMSHDQP